MTKERRPDIKTKSRDEVKQNTLNSRFKIVNCSRPIEFNESKKITVVDIEKQVCDDEGSEKPSTSGGGGAAATSTTTPTTTKDENFVYDLYLPDCNESGAVNGGGGDGAASGSGATVETTTDSDGDDNLIENFLRFVTLRETHYTVKFI